MSIKTIVKYNSKNQAIEAKPHGATRLIKRAQRREQQNANELNDQIKNARRMSLLGLTTREYYVRLGFIKPRQV